MVRAGFEFLAKRETDRKTDRQTDKHKRVIHTEDSYKSLCIQIWSLLFPKWGVAQYFFLALAYSVKTRAGPVIKDSHSSAILALCADFYT